MNQKGGIQDIILALVAIFVIGTVFLALWNPATGDGTRDVLYDLVNDSDFTTTYGTSVRDAVVYLIDLTPLLAMFAGVGMAAYLISKEMKGGKLNL